jgi:signal transduction histidine kinase
LSLNEPAIPVDVPKMIRVFVNLLKNAFDAMPNGGSMKVVSRTKPMEVEIEFSDTGMGMSQETLNRIWTPLFTTKAKGMGFGLAICKRFVEAHGGRIIVTSEEGKGTTFIIKIPRKLSPTEA